MAEKNAPAPPPVPPPPPTASSDLSITLDVEPTAEILPDALKGRRD